MLVRVVFIKNRVHFKMQPYTLFSKYTYCLTGAHRFLEDLQ